jgi:YegS/Rv2252/BmrU family lipid kinase
MLTNILRKVKAIYLRNVMPSKNTVLALLNPTSGNGIAFERWPKVAKLLEEFGFEYKLLAKPDISLAKQLVEHINAGGIAQYAAIVGIGGDGTHSEIINTLMQIRITSPEVTLMPYVIIPLGTGNDIAKSFGMSSREDFFVTDLRRAVAAIKYGADYWMDLGKAGNLYFANALTIGLDSNILKERNCGKAKLVCYPFLTKILSGYMLYTWALSRKFLKHTLNSVQVLVDGKGWYEGEMINLVICNTRIYAGEFSLCPDAYANDGLLDIIVFTGHTDYLTKYLLTLRKNPWQIQKMVKSLNKFSSITHGKNIEIKLATPEAAQYDGEEMSSSDKFEISIEPKAIHLRIPAEPP